MKKCTYCHALCEPLFCAKCKKRTYCSKKCQKLDWSKSSGQGHKIWCSQDVGENGIDWIIRECPDKGLGVFAMRNIPIGFKICVDRAWSQAEVYASEQLSGTLSSLEPQNGSLKEKFDLNAMSCPDLDNDSVVCMTMSRVNHSCDPNSEHMYVNTYKVQVLVALREIKKGEEICFSYASHDNIGDYNELTAERCRELLRGKWGIECSRNCICHDKARLKLVAKARKLDNKIVKFARLGDSDSAMDYVKQKAEILQSLGVSDYSAMTMRNCYDGFQIGIMALHTISIAKQFLLQALKVSIAFYGEDHQHTKDWKKYLDKPECHRNFKKNERYGYT